MEKLKPQKEFYAIRLPVRAKTANPFPAHSSEGDVLKSDTGYIDALAYMKKMDVLDSATDDCPRLTGVYLKNYSELANPKNRKAIDNGDIGIDVEVVAVQGPDILRFTFAGVEQVATSRE